jgi:hypothetical protein
LKLLKLENLTEELQDYIADNSGLGYVVGENFTAENSMEYTDIARVLGSKVLLTIFDENGTLISSGRQTHQERYWRFVTKGTHANAALDRARELLVWLWNTKTFDLTTYRVLVAQTLKMPEVVVRGESGSYLAEFVLQTLVFNKV